MEQISNSLQNDGFTYSFSLKQILDLMLEYPPTDPDNNIMKAKIINVPFGVVIMTNNPNNPKSISLALALQPQLPQSSLFNFVSSRSILMAPNGLLCLAFSKVIDNKHIKEIGLYGRLVSNDAGLEIKEQYVDDKLRSSTLKLENNSFFIRDLKLFSNTNSVIQPIYISDESKCPIGKPSKLSAISYKKRKRTNQNGGKKRQTFRKTLSKSKGKIKNNKK